MHDEHEPEPEQESVVGCWSLAIAATANTIQGCHKFVKITNHEYSRYTDYFWVYRLRWQPWCSVHCSVWSMQCAECSAHCAVHIVQCTLCSAPCAVHNVKCAVCTEECHSLSVGHEHVHVHVYVHVHGHVQWGMLPFRGSWILDSKLSRRNSTCPGHSLSYCADSEKLIIGWKEFLTDPV